jgi:hypothetical protein
MFCLIDRRGAIGLAKDSASPQGSSSHSQVSLNFLLAVELRRPNMTSLWSKVYAPMNQPDVSLGHMLQRTNVLAPFCHLFQNLNAFLYLGFTWYNLET